MVSKEHNNITKMITQHKESNNIMSLIEYGIKRNMILDSIRHRAKEVLPKHPKRYSSEDIITWRHRADRQILTYTNKSAVRTVLGAVSIVIGVSTLWLPSGSVLLIMLGAGLLGYDTKALSKKIKYELNWLKVRYL